MSFVSSIKNTVEIDSLTDNGAKTLETSNSKCVDLFFMIGASRGQDISNVFSKAYAENSELAIRILLWSRDIRQGAGERQIFRDLISYLEEHEDDVLEKIIPYMSEYGRWDDLTVFNKDKYQKLAFKQIRKALLQDENSLCAKWMPRKGSFAGKLRSYLKLDKKSYRKLLVNLTQVVEHKMCSNNWDDIDFSKLPSLASARYQNSFEKHSPKKYENYIESLKKGESKINAKSVYPYDVIQSLRFGNETVANEQWKALPNYLGDNDNAIIPMADVSGSMVNCKINKNLSALDVCISLSLYVADKQKGAFKGQVLTFSNAPRFCNVSNGSLYTKYNALVHADWGMDTNIEAAFKEILKVAIKNNIPEKDMPKILLIFSDMEFNSCISGKTIFNDMKDKFKSSGYKLPKVVFWNLKSRGGNVPVKCREDGTALISGFSPFIMKSILEAKHFNAEDIMLNTIMSHRYNIFNYTE